MTADYFYSYLKDYLTRKNDIRRGFDNFLKDRAEHAVHMYNAALKAEQESPVKLAIEQLLFDLDDNENSGFKTTRSDRGSQGKNNPFLLSDSGMKYYLVREMGRQIVLVQDNTGGHEPSSPYRYDEGNPKAKPVMRGCKWCLDRCVGVIPLEKEGRVLPDSDYDFVEVTPSFERFISKDEGFPPEWIKVNRISQHIDILYPFKHPMEEMDKLVGCENLKKRLLEFCRLTEYNKACLRQSPEIPVMQIFLHSIFYGNPGTGKSTVCRLYGSLLKEAGMLSKGHVVVADRKVFSGDCFGDNEAILKELVRYSEGGILLFDEAYLLEGNHPSDPNKLILPSLLSELADNHKKDFAVVLSGYKDKLDRMLEQNPGLFSRFSNTFEFKDYSLDELVEIGVRFLNTFEHTFSLDGLSAFKEELATAMSNSHKASWANARSVKTLIERIYICHAQRYVKGSNVDRVITSADICSLPYEQSRRIGF
ncbi:MAG: AAA family ATPase [Bacteroidaceae bacterium]|nr:AAA family ATPase [Bacteroidaceae bacterium]